MIIMFRGEEKKTTPTLLNCTDQVSQRQDTPSLRQPRQPRYHSDPIYRTQSAYTRERSSPRHCGGEVFGGSIYQPVVRW